LDIRNFKLLSFGEEAEEDDEEVSELSKVSTLCEYSFEKFTKNHRGI